MHDDVTERVHARVMEDVCRTLDTARDAAARVVSNASQISAAVRRPARAAIAMTAEEWRTFVAVIDMHLLTSIIACAPPPDAPADVAQQLRHRGSAVALRNLALLAESMRVMDALRHERMDALLYKGVVTAVGAYGSFAARELADVDLLLHPRDMDRAIDVLTAAGYRSTLAPGTNALRHYIRTYAQIPLIHADGYVMELHSALMPRYMPMGRADDGWFARRRSVEIGSMHVPTLGLDDQLLLACVHGTKERWPHLRAVADVAGLAARDGIDFDRVATLARESHTTRAFQLGMHLASWLASHGDHTGGGTVAHACRTGVAAAGALDDRVQSIARRVTERLTSSAPSGGPADEFTIVMGALDRQRDRMRFVMHHLTGHSLRDWSYWPGADRMLGVTRVTRPVRLAAVYGKAAARKIFS